MGPMMKNETSSFEAILWAMIVLCAVLGVVCGLL